MNEKEADSNPTNDINNEHAESAERVNGRRDNDDASHTGTDVPVLDVNPSTIFTRLPLPPTIFNGDPIDARVINISFYQVQFSNEKEFPYIKVGKPILEVEVLNHFTLHSVAKVLFDYRLEEEFGEDLYDHVWRFEPFIGSDNYGVKYNENIPILSNDMGYKGSYPTNNNLEYDKSRIQEGTDLLFFYDEGDARRVAVSIDKISPIPVGKSINDYPCKKGGIEEEEMNRVKRQRIMELPKLTILMDEAYPLLHERLMKERGVRLEIGKGSSLQANVWATIWGGGKMPAYTSSLECIQPFESMDEAWLCFDKGIEKQIGPNHPTSDEVIVKKNANGDTFREPVPSSTDKDQDWDFDIHVRPYPCSFHSHFYADEFSQLDLMNKKVMSRWAFNFSLPRNWLENPDNTR